MSAPEPQVRVETREHKGRMEYRWVCGACGWQPNAFGWSGNADPPESVARHNANCHSLNLARLQARWDARDATLRGLIEQWRAGAVIVRTDEADGERYRSVVTVGLDTVADELERAIGGGE